MRKIYEIEHELELAKENVMRELRFLPRGQYITLGKAFEYGFGQVNLLTSRGAVIYIGYDEETMRDEVHGTSLDFLTLDTLVDYRFVSDDDGNSALFVELVVDNA